MERRAGRWRKHPGLVPPGCHLPWLWHLRPGTIAAAATSPCPEASCKTSDNHALGTFASRSVGIVLHLCCFAQDLQYLVLMQHKCFAPALCMQVALFPQAGGILNTLMQRSVPHLSPLCQAMMLTPCIFLYMIRCWSDSSLTLMSTHLISHASLAAPRRL